MFAKNIYDRPLLPIKKLNKKGFSTTFQFYFLTFGICFLLTQIIYPELSISPQLPNLTLFTVMQSTNMTIEQIVWMYFAITVIGAPLLEELIYRKLLIPELKNAGMKNEISIIISAFMFAIAHIPSAMFEGDHATSSIQFFNTFTSGLFMGMAFVATGSVLSSMIIHALWNFYASFPLFAFIYDSDTAFEVLQWIQVGLSILMWIYYIYRYAIAEPTAMAQIKSDVPLKIQLIQHIVFFFVGFGVLIAIEFLSYLISSGIDDTLNQILFGIFFHLVIVLLLFFIGLKTTERSPQQIHHRQSGPPMP